MIFEALTGERNNRFVPVMNSQQNLPVAHGHVLNVTDKRASLAFSVMPIIMFLCKDGIYRPHRGHSTPEEFEKRFWSGVKIGLPDECWPWTKGKHGRKGYGTFSLGKNNNIKTHRYAFAITYGTIPDGKWVLHKCDNPPCCNPKHLFLGDNDINVQDCVQKGRRPIGKRVHTCVLDPETVILIREEHAAGLGSFAVLGEKYGVAQSTIGAIISRKSWKYLLEREFKLDE